MPKSQIASKIGKGKKSKGGSGSGGMPLSTILLGGGGALALLFVVMELNAWRVAASVLGHPHRCDACKALAGGAILASKAIGSAPGITQESVVGNLCTGASMAAYADSSVFGLPVALPAGTTGEAFVADATAACAYWMEMDEELRSEGESVREIVRNELSYRRQGDAADEMVKNVCFKTAICDDKETAAHHLAKKNYESVKARSGAWVQGLHAKWDEKKKEKKEKAKKADGAGGEAAE